MAQQTPEPSGSPSLETGDETSVGWPRLASLPFGGVQQTIEELRLCYERVFAEHMRLLAAQETSDESRHKYLEMFDFAPIGYFTMRPDGSMIEANQTCGAMLGTLPENLKGTDFAIYLSAADERVWRGFLDRVFSEGSRQQCELALRPAQGTPFRARIVAEAAAHPDASGPYCRVAMFDVTENLRNPSIPAVHDLPAGNPESLDAARRILSRAQAITDSRQAGEVLREAYETLEKRVAERTAELAAANAELMAEIRERRDVEEALRRSEERFSKAFLASPDGIIISRLRDGTVLEVNPSFCEVFGYDSGEVIGRSTLGLGLWPDLGDREFFSEGLRYRGYCNNLETVFLQKEGGRIPVLVSARVLELAGEPCVLSIIRDITDRKRAEEALRESEEAFKRCVEHSEAGFFQIDANSRFTYVNEAYARLHGYETANELIGQPFSAVQVEERVDLTGQLVGRMLRGQTVKGEEFPRRCKDGSIGYHTFSARPIIRGDQIIGVEGFIIDTTERRRLHEQMQQSQKLESLGVMAGGIAHDFNNILVGIIGNADLALLEMDDRARVTRSLGEIAKAAKRAARLTEQMLAYSGRGAFVVEPVNLSQLVGDMAPLLMAAVSGKARLEFELAEDLDLVQGDVSQLKQVVVNLVTNAHEAITHSHGLVTVRTALCEANRELLSTAYVVDNLPEGTYVCIEVSDNGCGMDEETRVRMFDPFFTTKFIGRGLGLGAVLGIVRGHQGALRVESTFGEGTRFSAMFPSLRIREGKRSVDSQSGSEAVRVNTVLVVDDEAIALDIARQVLERLGYSTITVDSGAAAVALFSEDPSRFGCVLLDLTMPDMDGQETFRALRRIRNDVPIVLSSGYSENQALERFSSTGLSGFLQKPYSIATMRETIERAMSGTAP